MRKKNSRRGLAYLKKHSKMDTCQIKAVQTSKVVVGGTSPDTLGKTEWLTDNVVQGKRKLV